MTINWLSDDSLHRDVIDIIQRVQRSQMTPDEAEEWARAHVHVSFVATPETLSSNPIEAPYWPIPLTVAWIFAREQEAAAVAR
jgi:hypothetical protein